MAPETLTLIKRWERAQAESFRLCRATDEAVRASKELSDRGARLANDIRNLPYIPFSGST
jgi:hypothetical protein